MTHCNIRNCKGTSTGDYMLRTIQQHHVQLSIMADSKASIIKATLAIVISLTVNNLIQTEYIITTTFFITCSLLSLSFALFSVAPIFTFQNSMIKTIFQKEKMQVLDPFTKNINPLSFGHFTCWDFKTYYKIMNTILEDQELVYYMLIKDLYQMGLVLKKKYNYINISYKFFFFGILFTLLLFFIEHYLVL